MEISLPPHPDPLGEALLSVRMSGTMYCRCEFTAPWALVLPALKGFVMFHVVTSGQCWLETEGDEPRMLRPGDLALLPHGDGHRLASRVGLPGAKLFDLPRDQVSERYEVLRHGGGGTPTTVICGAIQFDHPSAHHVIKVLPKVICVGAFNSPQMDWIQMALRFIAAEAKELRPGGEAAITRLADFVVIQAIRTWIEQEPAAQRGWLAALRDSRLAGRSL
jgi:Cupin